MLSKSSFRIFAFLSPFFFWGCSSDYLLDLGAESLPSGGTWLIDESFILQACPGQDCIPNLTNPEMVQSGSPQLSYLDDNDLVVGIKRGENTYAFPHPILDWHEIVNMGDYTISYCPLTGSALHVMDDRGFGVSGLLYNSNLIMYDKESNSFWPQMFLKSAAGRNRGEELVIDRMIETTWGTWKKLFPETYVVSSQTGHSRNYNAYPYGTFKSDNNINFPIENSDSRLHPKRRVMGILSGSEARAYQIADFGTASIVHDVVGGENFVIFGSAKHNFIVTFRTNRHFSVKSYDLDNGGLLFTDSETGSVWNIFGEAVSGTLEGEVLAYGKSFISYWFAWAAFYPQTNIWKGAGK